MHFAMSTGCKLKLNGFRIGDDVIFILKYALSVAFFINRNRLIEKGSLLLSEFQYYKCWNMSDDNLLRHFHYRRPSCLKRLFVSLYQPFTLSGAMNKILHMNYCEHGARVFFFYYFKRRHRSLRVGSNPCFGNFFLSISYIFYPYFVSVFIVVIFFCFS